MKSCLLTFLLALCASALPAQAAPAQPAAKQESSDLGFTYKLPNSWEVLGIPSSMAQAKSEAGQNSASEEEKKGLNCLQLVLTARDPNSGSVVSVQALPFACFGHQMTEEDLPGFASAAPEALKQSFDLSDPVYGSYVLGSHSMWIARTRATLKNHPEMPFTVEITCGLLKKAAVCWMAVAGTEDALRVFEQTAVTLDGEALSALVPPTAFDKKPS